MVHSEAKIIKPPDKEAERASFLPLVLLRKKSRTPDEEGMLAAYKTPLDATDRSSINDLVAYAKGN